jgi:hypothetical protein
MIVIETSGEIENTHSEFKLKMQELGLIWII